VTDEKQRKDLGAWIQSLPAYIPVLIGVISVVGALATWQAVRHGSAASDRDRQAILEAVTQERALARSELKLRFEEAQYAKYRGDLAAADFLERLSVDARGGGDEAKARQYEIEAANLRDVAENMATLTFPGLENYLTGEGDKQRFDLAKRRDELEREDQEAFEADPKQTSSEADAFRSKSQRLIAAVSLFALSVVLLSVAYVGSGRLQSMLAIAGTGLFLVIFVLAIALGV
jgi:hypothetical protein